MPCREVVASLQAESHQQSECQQCGAPAEALALHAPRFPLPGAPPARQLPLPPAWVSPPAAPALQCKCARCRQGWGLLSRLLECGVWFHMLKSGLCLHLIFQSHLLPVTSIPRDGCRRAHTSDFMHWSITATHPITFTTAFYRARLPQPGSPPNHTTHPARPRTAAARVWAAPCWAGGHGLGGAPSPLEAAHQTPAW